MYWLRWHYHVKDIAGAAYKIKKKSKQKRQNCRSHWEGTVTECWTSGGRYHQHGWVSRAQTTTTNVDVRCPVHSDLTPSNHYGAVTMSTYIQSAIILDTKPCYTRAMTLLCGWGSDRFPYLCCLLARRVHCLFTLFPLPTATKSRHYLPFRLFSRRVRCSLAISSTYDAGWFFPRLLDQVMKSIRFSNCSLPLR